jgi:hypothetical protein
MHLGYDGLNIDYEGNRHGAITGFTELVVETSAALHGNISGAQLSIDAPGYAGFEFRDYDYKAIADALDLMYVFNHVSLSRALLVLLAQIAADYGVFEPDVLQPDGVQVHHGIRYGVLE